MNLPAKAFACLTSSYLQSAGKSFSMSFHILVHSILTWSGAFLPLISFLHVLVQSSFGGFFSLFFFFLFVCFPRIKPVRKLKTSHWDQDSVIFSESVPFFPPPFAVTDRTQISAQISFAVTFKAIRCEKGPCNSYKMSAWETAAFCEAGVWGYLWRPRLVFLDASHCWFAESGRHSHGLWSFSRLCFLSSQGQNSPNPYLLFLYDHILILLSKIIN